MVSTPFLDRLKQGKPLLADGAMGTMLYSRGIRMETCFDQLNLTKPDVITGIHRDYIAAGAEMIETNTFSANRFKLADFGLEDKVGALNHAGAQLARQAIEASGRE